MKKITIMIVAVIFSISSKAGMIYVPVNSTDNAKVGIVENAGTSKSVFLVNNEINDRFKSDIQAFLKLTPGKYHKLTGKKLTIKEVVKLKAAQKFIKSNMKKDGEDKLPKGGYIVLLIFGFGFISLGIVSDWKGNDWWVNLLLTCLCWLPGLIHGLIKMKDYYK